MIATPLTVGTGNIVTISLGQRDLDLLPVQAQEAQAALDAMVSWPEGLLEIRVTGEDRCDRHVTAARVHRRDLDAARQATSRGRTPLEYVRHEQAVTLDAGPETESDELSFLEEGAVG